MLTRGQASQREVRGYTMIEVLVAMVVLAVGILGVAGLMAKMHQSEAEAYQRAQALLLLQEMGNRVAIAGLGASSYVTTDALGTGDSKPASCAGLTFIERDQCEWSRALKGAAETQGPKSVGTMIGARGCVEEVQKPDATDGVCQPGVYRVSVVWQGLTETAAQTGLTCGSGNYGSKDSLRRAISSKITIGVPKCS